MQVLSAACGGHADAKFAQVIKFDDGSWLYTIAHIQARSESKRSVTATPSQQTTTKPLRLVIMAGAAVAFCILGDSLLYAVLPLAAPDLGISLPLVGILLSANRLVRLGSNTWVGGIFERMGPRRPFIASSIVGLLSTVLYGAGWGFTVFLAARLLWGIAWSGLRQGGYQAVWAGSPTMKGRLMGLLWGLIRLGSACSVLIGGMLYDRYGYFPTITLVILVSILSVPLAFAIRWPDAAHIHAAHDASTGEESTSWRARIRQFGAGWRAVLDAPHRRWLVGAGLVAYFLHSIVVSTLSLFLQQRLGEGAHFAGWTFGVATIAGLILTVRWLIDLGFGPALGYLSDKLGQPQTAALLVCVQYVALLSAANLPPAGAVAGIILVFLCDGGMSIVLNAAASGIATETARPHQYVSIFTTSTDAGSAIGPLLAYTIGGVFGISTMYLAVGAVLVVVIWRYWRLSPIAYR